MIRPDIGNLRPWQQDVVRLETIAKCFQRSFLLLPFCSSSCQLYKVNGQIYNRAVNYIYRGGKREFKEMIVMFQFLSGKLPLFAFCLFETTKDRRRWRRESEKWEWLAENKSVSLSGPPDLKYYQASSVFRGNDVWEYNRDPLPVNKVLHLRADCETAKKNLRWLLLLWIWLASRGV